MLTKADKKQLIIESLKSFECTDINDIVEQYFNYMIRNCNIPESTRKLYGYKIIDWLKNKALADIVKYGILASDMKYLTMYIHTSATKMRGEFPKKYETYGVVEGVIDSAIKDKVIPLYNKYKDVKDVEWLWDPNKGAEFVDWVYRTTSEDGWKFIIEEDYVNKDIYIEQIYDCDDFARIFKAICVYVYYINTVGYCAGAVVRLDTNEVIGYHAYNMIFIPTRVEDKVVKEGKVVWYEPQTSEISEDGRYEIIIDNNRVEVQYVPNFWIRF